MRSYIGLLFFSDNPDIWFPGARIEVVQFAAAGGDVQEERIFRGGLHEQLRDASAMLAEELIHVLFQIGETDKAEAVKRHSGKNA